VSFFEKGKGRFFGYIKGYKLGCTPSRLTPHPQVLTGAHNFPPHLSGVPPDPVPPLRLHCGRKRLAVPKLGGAGGSPLILPADGQNRDLCAVGAEAALLAWLRCSAGRTGSAGYAADRTPAGAGARGRERPGVRSADKCGGGVKAQAIDTKPHDPAGSGSLSLPGTRENSRVLFARRYPQPWNAAPPLY